MLSGVWRYEDSWTIDEWFQVRIDQKIKRLILEILFEIWEHFQHSQNSSSTTDNSLSAIKSRRVRNIHSGSSDVYNYQIAKSSHVFDRQLHLIINHVLIFASFFFFFFARKLNDSIFSSWKQVQRKVVSSAIPKKN